MATYTIVVVNENKRPIQGITVEAVDLSDNSIGATGTTDAAGAVVLSVTGIHFFRPRVRRVSSTVGDRVYTGVVEVQVVQSDVTDDCTYDFVVDDAGDGTHTALFGASGALEAAIDTGGDRTIYVCPGHTEAVAAKHDLTALAAAQHIIVLSSGRNRPVFTVASGLGTDPLIDNATAGSNVTSMLRFQGLAFRRASSDGASAGPFLQGNGGFALPNFELIDVTFEPGNDWTYILDGDTANSCDVRDFMMDNVHVEGAITAVFATKSNLASTGQTVIRDCDFFRITNIQERDASSDLDVGLDGIHIQNNIFRLITGYAWTRTGKAPFVFTGNIVLNFDAAGSLIDIGTSGTTSPVDATIDGNFIRCSNTSANTRAVTITGGGGTAENISVVGNALRGPTGANAHIAVAFDLANKDCVVLNSYRDWTTNVGGSIGFNSNAEALSDRSAFISSILQVVGDTPLFWIPNGGDTTTATDASRNQKTITYSKDVTTFDNPPALQGKGLYVHFDGTDEQADTPDTADMSFGNGTADNAFSIIALLYSDDATSKDVISKYDDDAADEEEWRLFFDASDQPTFQIFDDSVPAHIGRLDATAWGDAAWHLLIATYDATEASSGINIYKDGVVVDDTDAESGSYVATQAGDQAVRIGTHFTASAEAGFFDGRMGFILVCSKELSADEVWQIKELVNGHYELTL